MRDGTNVKSQPWPVQINKIQGRLRVAAIIIRPDAPGWPEAPGVGPIWTILAFQDISVGIFPLTRMGPVTFLVLTSAKMTDVRLSAIVIGCFFLLIIFVLLLTVVLLSF